MSAAPGGGPRIPSGHVLLVHDAGDQRWAALAAWTMDGLRSGEKVILTSMDLASSQAMLTALEHAGADVTSVLSSDQLRFSDLEDFYPEDGQEGLVADALAEGYPGVRLSGPAALARTQMSRREHETVEARMDELCRRYPLSALCQYDATLVADGVASTVATHPVVADAMGLVATTAGPPDSTPGTLRIQLQGEFDSGNAALLEQALVRAGESHGEVGRIELDLAGLRFLSVAAGRALLDGTGAYRGKGGTVLIRGADLHLTQVLALLTVADHAGIDVEGT